jgi:hypothetical protein
MGTGYDKIMEAAKSAKESEEKILKLASVALACAEHLFESGVRDSTSIKELPPMWMLETPDGRIHTPVCFGYFTSEETKDLFAEKIRMKAREIGAVRIAFICEAWVAPDDNRNNLSPRFRDDRREVLTVTVEDKLGMIVSFETPVFKKNGKDTLNIENTKHVVIQEFGQENMRFAGTLCDGDGNVSRH